jgi:hypothetical protein
MFGNLKRNLVIEKAYDLWRRQAGLDLKAEVSKFPYERQIEYRDMLRESQKSMDANELEVAVIMILPFVQFLGLAEKAEVNNLIDAWAHRAQIRGTIASQFKQALYSA